MQSAILQIYQTESAVTFSAVTAKIEKSEPHRYLRFGLNTLSTLSIITTFNCQQWVLSSASHVYIYAENISDY